MLAKLRFLLIFSVLGGCDLGTPATTAADNFPAVSGGGSVLYVSARTGTADGDGSSAKPFSTISAASRVATSGTTIAIAAGDYPENLSVVAGISLVGLSAATVTISGKSGPGIAIAGSGTTSLAGLHVIGSSGAGITVKSDNNDDGATLQISGVEVSGVTASGASPGDGIDFEQVASAEIDSCSIHDNAGVGVTARASGTVSIIDPLFNKDPRGSGSTVGIIDPLFLPASIIHNNAGGGVSIIDPLFLTGDANSLSIQGTDIGGNGHFGVSAQGGNVAIQDSAIHGSLGTDGDGLRIASGTQVPSGPLRVSVTNTIVTGNARTGVFIDGPAALSFSGESSLNGHGGLWAQHPQATISTDASAVIARNTQVGIAVTNGATLSVVGSTISDTQEYVYTPAGATTTVSAADGIGVYTAAHAAISGATLSGNIRAAVLAKDCAANAAGAPDMTVENCTISGSKWGIVVNGHYSEAMPAVGAAQSNDFQGVDASKQDDTTSDLDAPVSTCADGSFTCSP